jgi:hypothetical protein
LVAVVRERLSFWTEVFALNLFKTKFDSFKD